MENVKYRYLRIALVTLLISLTGSFIRAQTLGSLHLSSGLDQGNELIIKEGVALEEALERVEEQFNVVFLYRTDVVENKRVLSTQILSKDVKKALEKLLEDQDLSFRYLNPKTYGIYSVEKPAVQENVIPTQEQITGTVTDGQSGETLPGVNILVKGTTTGTSTDSDGTFELEVSSLQDTLVVTYIGYQRQEVPVNGRTNLDIQLNPEAIVGEEMVVVGYGEQRAVDLTGSVASVEVEQINEVPAMRVDQSLQGKASGVQVTSVSGAPGAGTTIRIRGGNSINASNEPLYVIDGIIGIDNLNSINPGDIESIEILKDASAKAIYGTRGSNGVVLITTKSGYTTTKDRINIRMSRGWQSLPSQIDVMNAVEYAELFNDWNRHNDEPLLYPNPESLEGQGTNWQEAITRTAPQTNLQISTSGGNESFRYYISGNYIDQQGIILDSGTKRYQLRANLDRDIGERLRISNRLNISRIETDNNTISLGLGTGSGFAQSALAVAPTLPVFNEEGGYFDDHPWLTRNFNNPISQINEIIDEEDEFQVLNNLSAIYDVAQNLELKSSLSFNATNQRANFYQSTVLPTRRSNDLGGMADVSTFRRYNILNENTVNYTPAFNENNRMDLLAGFTYQASVYEGLEAGADRFNNDVTTYNNLALGAAQTREVGTSYESYTIASFLGRARYILRDRYLFTVVGRYDGSSRLGENDKWALFPSGSFAWRINQEPFMDEIDFISNLKLRTSFGYTGNQAVAIYATQPTLNETSYLFGNQQRLGLVQGRLAKPNLKWERTGEFNIGLDIGMFNDRLNVTADYYRKNTTDLLLEEEVAWQTGYNTTLNNVGEVRNEGFEFSIQSDNVRTNDFLWQTDFTISTNSNKVIDLGDKDEIITQRLTFGNDMPTSYLKEGRPVGVFYVAKYLGTWKSQQEIDEVGTMPGVEPGSPRYEDVDGNGSFDVNDFIAGGEATPDFFGGLGNTFRYRNLSLNIFFQFSYGNEVFNGADSFLNTGEPFTNVYSFYTDRWSPDNRDSDIPVFSRDYVPSTRWVYDGSFLRLKNMQLTYSVPVEKLNWRGIEGVSISLIGQNLFLWDNYIGYDPEVNSYGTNSVLRGYDYTEYPRARTFSVGLNLEF